MWFFLHCIFFLHTVIKIFTFHIILFYWSGSHSTLSERLGLTVLAQAYLKHLTILFVQSSCSPLSPDPQLHANSPGCFLVHIWDGYWRWGLFSDTECGFSVMQLPMSYLCSYKLILNLVTVSQVLYCSIIILSLIILRQNYSYLMESKLKICAYFFFWHLFLKTLLSHKLILNSLVFFSHVNLSFTLEVLLKNIWCEK